jgi:hypothetical protein
LKFACAWNVLNIYLAIQTNRISYMM